MQGAKLECKVGSFVAANHITYITIIERALHTVTPDKSDECVTSDQV